MSDIHIHLPFTAGQHPNQEGPPARSGAAGIRRLAASRFGTLDPGDGQKAPNLPGDRPAENVVTPNKGPTKQAPDRNKKPLEKQPVVAKEPIPGDGFSQAREKALQLHRKGR